MRKKSKTQRIAPIFLMAVFWVFGASVCMGSPSVTAPKAGVYDDFQAVKDGQPSRDLPARLKQYTHHVVGFFRATKVELYQLDIDRHQARAMGPVFALSDGAQLYLYPRFPSPVQRYSDYVPVEPIGPYFYGQSVSVSSVPSGDNHHMKETLVELLYDTRTGRFSALNPRSLRMIIADDVELSARFQSERRKRSKLKLYLQEYVARGAARDRSTTVP